MRVCPIEEHEPGEAEAILWSSIKAGGQAPIPGPSQRVLVPYSDERLLPANIIVDESIHAVFTADTSNRIELHSEFLDVTGFPGEDQRQRQQDLSGRSVRGVRPTC